MGLRKKNVYRRQRITDLDSLKTIAEELDKISQEINYYVETFRPRLRCVIKVEGRYIERY